MENNLTTPTAQAQRLEALCAALEAELRQPGVMDRLRQPGSENEWSAMQTLGHIVEMIPYWMRDCQRIIASDSPPPFGRGIDAPERLEGVEQAASKNPDELLKQLRSAVTFASADILAISTAERAKKGIHIRKGETSVAEIIETFVVGHAEDHLAQIHKALQV